MVRSSAITLAITLVIAGVCVGPRVEAEAPTLSDAQSLLAVDITGSIL